MTIDPGLAPGFLFGLIVKAFSFRTQSLSGIFRFLAPVSTLIRLGDRREPPLEGGRAGKRTLAPARVG